MNIGIFIYDEAEVLDFSGPFEVFSVAKRLYNDEWNVFLISEKGETVSARGNFQVKPHYSISDHPEIHLFMVVGGIHSKELEKANVINWVGETAEAATRVASVCTGSFLLAEAGLLEGLQVTTHWEDIPDLKSSYPSLQVVENRRWIEQNKYITSGGISAGIDMSLFLVSQLISMEAAEQVAQQMEYRWQRD